MDKCTGFEAKIYRRPTVPGNDRRENDKISTFSSRRAAEISIFKIRHLTGLYSAAYVTGADVSRVGKSLKNLFSIMFFIVSFDYFDPIPSDRLWFE